MNLPSLRPLLRLGLGISANVRYGTPCGISGVLIILVGFFIFIGFLLPDADRITPESYEKIRLGMSWEEVESLLGAPGFYASQDRIHSGMVRHRWMSNSPPGALDADKAEGEWSKASARKFAWYGESGAIIVILDKKGHAANKRFLSFPARSWLERIDDWIPVSALNR